MPRRPAFSLALAGLALAACGSSRTAGGSAAPPVCKPFTAAVTHTQLSPIAGTNSQRFHVEGVKPVAVLAGGDGIWFSEDATHHVGHINASGNLTEYEVNSLATGALQMALASDGSVWVPGGSHAGLIHLVPGGTSLDCTLPDPSSHPLGAALAADGRVWVSESGSAAVAIFDGHRFAEVHLAKNAMPQEFAAAAQGGYWVSDFNHGTLLRVRPEAVAATIDLGQGSDPIGLLGVSDGVWAAEFGNNAVVHVDPSGVAGIPIQVPGKAIGTQALAVARDGGLWFTESRVDRLGHISVAGKLQDWPVDGDWPDHVTVDGAGNVWFSEYNSSDMAILQVHL